MLLAVILTPSSVILSAAKDPFHLTQDKLREGFRQFAGVGEQSKIRGFFAQNTGSE
jgi:hypothetical protein